MTTNKLDGLSLWLRQGGDIKLTSGRLIDYCKNNAGTGTLTHKLMDGLTWQGTFDNGESPVSMVGAKNVAKAWEEAGGQFIPVVVPRGLKGEAQAHGQLARQFGYLLVDLEPYDGFWDKAPYNQIEWYTRELRQEAPDAYLVLQADPRLAPWEQIDGYEQCKYFDALCNQHYVGWTSVGWTSWSQEVARFREIQAEAVKANPSIEMYATLYNADALIPALNFGQAIANECYGFNIFALASASYMATPDRLEPFKRMNFQFKKRVGKPEPEPKPSVDWRAVSLANFRHLHQWAVRDAIAAAMRQEAVEREMTELGFEIPVWSPDQLK